MEMIRHFLHLVDLYCQARGISEARASTIILNGGSRIGAIRSGSSDIGAKRLEAAVQWLSDNWPDDLADWPNDIPRPARTEAESSRPFPVAASEAGGV
jgi:hypothetical protein